MRKVCLLLAMIALSVSAMAQSGRIAYMYSEKVFNSMPAYKSAVQEIEKTAKTASTEATKMLEGVQEMYQNYVKNSSKLDKSSNEALKKAIINKEKEANEYEQKTVKAKKEELMSPLETKVIDASKAVALEKGYDMILDLSVTKVALYTNPTLDVTEAVISKIK